MGEAIRPRHAGAAVPPPCRGRAAADRAMTAVPKPTPTMKEPRTLKQRVHRIPRHVRAMVYARDMMTCRWCKRPGGALDPHHILRRSQGGTDDQANLVS